MKTSGKTPRDWLRLGVGYTVGAACLYWVFHDVQPRAVWEALARVRWAWVVVAAALDVLTYVCVAWEWQVLLRPVGRLSLLKLSQAVFAGRFANDVLPVHVGYVIRVYLAAHWLGVGLARVLPSLLVERLLEGLWLASGIGLVALFVPLPPAVLRTGRVLAGFVGGGILVISAVMVYRRLRGSGSEVSQAQRRGWLGRIAGFVERMVAGIRGIGAVRLLVAGGALSLLKLAVQGLAFVSLLWAYGFQLSGWVQVAVFLVACVGISLPSTPASVGVFQLFCVAGLEAFGVPKPAATSFALLAFVVLTAPLALGGFIAVAHSGLTLRQIRQEVGRWKEAIGQEND